MGNPKAIAFSNVANRQELPSDEDFKKVETMIGEFLKLSSTDLPHTVKMAGQLLARPLKDASSPVSKDPSRPLATQPLPPDPTKARTKQGSTKKQGELPQPSKSLVLQRKPKGSQTSQVKKDTETTKTKKRKREDETMAAQKKTKVTEKTATLEGRDLLYLFIFIFYFYS